MMERRWWRDRGGEGGRWRERQRGRQQVEAREEGVRRTEQRDTKQRDIEYTEQPGESEPRPPHAYPRITKTPL